MCFHCCEVPRLHNSIETESRMGSMKDWGVGVLGTQFQFGKMEKILEMDSGDGCSTV